CLNWSEITNIYLLCAKTENVKLIEGGLNFYDIIVSEKLLPSGVVNEIQNHWEELNINSAITIKILQLVHKILSNYHTSGPALSGYLSFCVKMTSSSNANIRDAARHTVFQVCHGLIDKLLIGSSNPDQQEFIELLFSVIVLLRDIIHMLLGEIHSWLSVPNNPNDLFLIELLSQMITGSTTVFIEVASAKLTLQIPEMNRFLSTDVVDGLVKMVHHFNKIFDEPNALFASSTLFNFDKQNTTYFMELIKLIHFICSRYFTNCVLLSPYR
ncbi:hypothetical protein MXB_2994, partial [Myxobolus squamalis]